MLRHRVREWTSIHRSLELAYAAGFRSRLVEIVDAWSRSGCLDSEDAQWLSRRSPRLRFEIASRDGSAQIREDLGHAYRSLPFADLSAWIRDPDECFAVDTADPERGERLVLALERVATLRFLEILQTLNELGLEPAEQVVRLRRCPDRKVLAFDVSKEGDQLPPFSAAAPLGDETLSRLRRNLKTKSKRRPIEDSDPASTPRTAGVSTSADRRPRTASKARSQGRKRTSVAIRSTAAKQTARKSKKKKARTARRSKRAAKTTSRKRRRPASKFAKPKRCVMRRNVRRRKRPPVIARRTKLGGFGRRTRIRRTTRRGPVPALVAEFSSTEIRDRGPHSVIRRSVRRRDPVDEAARKLAIQWTRRVRDTSPTH